MPVEGKKTIAKSSKESEVAAILKQMAMVFKNLRTYQPNNPTLKNSFDGLFDKIVAFLDVNASLTLLVKEHDLVFGSTVVYSSDEKMDSLAFALYKDGIRLLTFRDGLPRRELQKFMRAVNDARDADPYQADLVTILWENDLSYITYRAVEAYLEDDEKKRIEELVQKCSDAPAPPHGDTLPGSEFFIKELGLSPRRKDAERRRQRTFREAEVRRIAREILDEDDEAILRRCSDICLEILSLAPKHDTFDRVVDFIGRISEWLVASSDFLSACTIISDLRTIATDTELEDARKASIVDTIARLGERQKIRSLGERLETLSESRAEEIFAYLALLGPNAVEPLCEILADCEVRKIRYLLCRAISVIGKNEPERLRHFIMDKRWFFVRNIVMILGMMANPGGTPLLRQVMSHQEARVRREVARSVGRIRSGEGLDILQVLLDDDNKLVRIATLSAIRDVEAGEARDFLEPRITDKSFGKMSDDEKREILRTYGALGQDSFGFLEAVIEGRFSHMDERTRALAVYGIAMIDTKETMTFLRELIGRGDGPLRYAASEALATLVP
jgi:HEAT repeat protein